MAERWFFALWPDETTSEALAARARRLIPTGARAAHRLDLHLTICFLGELTPSQLLVAGQAADAVQARPFDLNIDHLGAFPKASVLWCAPSCWPSALHALTDGLRQALADRGFSPERKPLRPHITLARRFQGSAPSAWGPAVVWEARDYCLAYGRDGQVPRYCVARRWPLAAPG